ncbi:hypothetical protein KKH35_02600 [Patescibacteria group bacterium]|nr:hypothetical protein [Patescibacteria group bacterium]
MIESRECVTTLPITPMNRPSVGLNTTPFLMDAFGKRLGRKTVLSLNANGSKLYNQDTEKHVSGYLSSLDILGITPDFIWRDDQEENISWINLFFNQLQKSGYISREMASVIKCECGAVESLAEAENISPSRTLCVVDKGKMYCRLCNSEVREFRELVYLFNFPASIGLKKVFPSFYIKEIEAMILKFKDYKFLISRSRPSALALWTGEGNIFLDVDFVWQMFLPILCRYGYESTILVGGNKNLMACCFSMIISHLIDQRDIFLIIPPYYLAPGRKSLKGEQYLSDNLVSEYGQKSVRLLLATAINWTKKESVLDLNLIKLISKMAYRIYGAEKITDIEAALADFEGKKIKKLLAQFRKTRDAFHNEELFGLI